MALNEDLERCQISAEEAAESKKRALAIKEEANKKFAGLHVYKLPIVLC